MVRTRMGDEDHLHDECGVVAVFGHPEAPKLIYLGLYALQHRGQEGAGIVCSDNGMLTAHRGVGLVSDVFKPHKLARVQGDRGIGHVRYSTFGSSNLRNVQPLVVDYARGSMAVAHNGNLTNATLLRAKLEAEGAIFQATTDSEVILHLISRSRAETFTDCLVDALRQVVGAYSVVATDGEVIVAARDPMGFRPLWLGKLEETWVVASETCALDIMDAQWVREIEPGEVVTIRGEGVESIRPFPPATPRQCLFEFVYVARPDSCIFGKSVDEVRKELG
ncbi:MAG TPA: class II glutamine amidotransferase, partial [Candidatus Hydrogenedentes bacterium]|nr:class II glutamine amidotransferase [Candidatus Hydrogenedentota bacterium]